MYMWGISMARKPLLELRVKLAMTKLFVCFCLLKVIEELMFMQWMKMLLDVPVGKVENQQLSCFCLLKVIEKSIFML